MIVGGNIKGLIPTSSKKEQNKPKTRRKEEIIKIRAEIKEIEMEKQ